MPQPQPQKHIPIRLFGILLTVLVLGTTLILLGGLAEGSEKIYPGVKMKGINLGGTTLEQAQRQLEALALEVETTPVTLMQGEHAYSLTWSALGVGLDIPVAVGRVWAVGREQDFRQRLVSIWQARTKGIEIPVPYAFREEMAMDIGKQVGASFSRLPVDAALEITEEDQVLILPAQPGWQPDTARLREQIERSIASGELPKVLEIRMTEVQPSISTQMVKELGISGLVASFTTPFNPQNVNRSENIRVAASALDNLYISPNEEFSFNRIVGPRSTEAGYKNALVIQGNEFVQGIGGGVCQVSTTLYNAVLLANLPVVERRRHSLPVEYVGKGLDATVVYGYVDLRFRNNTGNHLLVKTKIENGDLTVKIFGSPEKHPRVKILNEVEAILEPPLVQRPDPSLPEGKMVVEQKGGKGFRTLVRRIVEIGGQEFTEEISRDTYPPIPRVIRIGTAKTTVQIQEQPSGGI